MPAGIIEKLQVRIFDSNGRLVGTQNVKPATDAATWQSPLPGMPAGGTVQVQANVKGIDGRRNDVVTVSDIAAVTAPDLAVTGLVLPGAALTGVPTVLAATIAETGGQRGASANCVLYVDGVAVDRSSNIWVDAGDVVSCAFTRVFTTPGTALVRVALEDVRPADGEPSNNSAEGSIDVMTPSPAAAGAFLDGSVSSGTFISADTFETVWTASNGSVFLEQRSHSRVTGSDFSFNVNGVIPGTLVFPLARVEIAQSGDGRLLHSERMLDVTASVSPGASCSVSPGSDGSTLYICSYDAGFTAVALVHSAGTVTYQSSDYSRFWNGTSYDEDGYVVNQTTTTGTFQDVRQSFAVNIQIMEGSTLYALDGSTPMTATQISDLEPRQCVSSPVSVPPETYAAQSCFASAYVFNGFQGMLVTSAQP